MELRKANVPVIAAMWIENITHIKYNHSNGNDNHIQFWLPLFRLCAAVVIFVLSPFVVGGDFGREGKKKFAPFRTETHPEIK